jgi:hypothetical protein
VDMWKFDQPNENQRLNTSLQKTDISPERGIEILLLIITFESIPEPSHQIFTNQQPRHEE